MSALNMRVERLADERARTHEKLTDLVALAEEESRPLSEEQQEQAAKYRQQIEEYDTEIDLLAVDIERKNNSRDVSALLRSDEGDGGDGGEKRYARAAGTSRDALAHRTYVDYARDYIIAREPKYAGDVLATMGGDASVNRAQAEERLERTLQNVTSTTVAGLIVPTHMTEILDIIDKSRPVADSGRKVPLDRGSMTYPAIGTRPSVILQSAEKTEAGTVAPTVTQGTLAANTYLGATNISWQAANWSNPEVIGLYFELAAEAYARQTEDVACEALETSAIGTVGTASGRLGTAGTESFAAWRSAVAGGVAAIYAATGGRHRTNALYLSADRFFALATLGTDQVVQMSPIGNVDMGAMTGSFFGLRVIGSRGFDQNTAIVGDSGALLVGENPGSPVEMRIIEPRIGGWEVGLIGAFNAVVFDPNRFQHLGTHL